MYQPDSKSTSSSIPRHSKKNQNTFPSFSNAYWKHRWLKMTVNTLCMNRQSCCFSLITASIVWYVKSNCNTSSVFMLFCVNRSLAWAISFYETDETKFPFKEEDGTGGLLPLFLTLAFSLSSCLFFLTQGHKRDLKLEDWHLLQFKSIYSDIFKMVLKKMYLYLKKCFTLKSRLFTAVFFLVWLWNCTKLFPLTIEKDSNFFTSETRFR